MVITRRVSTLSTKWVSWLETYLRKKSLMWLVDLGTLLASQLKERSLLGEMAKMVRWAMETGIR
jgi:hypothetical protein